MFREQHICKKVKSHTSKKTNKSLHTHKLSKEKKKRVYTQKYAYIKGKNKTRYRWGFKHSDSGQRLPPLSISRKIVVSLN